MPPRSLPPRALAALGPDPAAVAWHAENLLRAFQSDRSEFALRPRDPDTLLQVTSAIAQARAEAGALSTASRDATEFHGRWAEFCKEEYATPPLRADVAANCGLDVFGHERECFLLSHYLLRLHATMRPKRRGATKALPTSAMNVIYSVRRYHRAAGITMVTLASVTLTLRGLLRRFVREQGPEALIPQRKQHFEPEILVSLLDVPAGAQLGSVVWKPESRFGLNHRGFHAYLRESGARGGDVALGAREVFDMSCLSAADLSFKIGGREYRAPSLRLLASAAVGDYVIGAPPCAKNDPLRTFFGNQPVYFAYRPDVPWSFAARRIEYELAFPIPPHERRTTPLFIGPDKAALRKSLADRIFAAMIARCPLIRAEQRTWYSLHSFRVTLACALLATGASSAQIQALCRWKSVESLAIYARLNPADYMLLVRRADFAQLRSITHAQLPQLDLDQELAECAESTLDEET